MQPGLLGDWAALGMGLHGAAGRGQPLGEGGLQSAMVEGQDAAGCRDEPKPPAVAGRKKAKSLPAMPVPNAGRDIDADSDCRDRFAAVEMQPPFVRRRPGLLAGPMPWRAPRRPRAGNRIPGCASARH